MKIKLLIATAIITMLQGCSIMPYQEESSCNFNDLGRCLPIDKAYKEAITGINQGGTLVNGEAQENIINKVVNDQALNIDKIIIQNQLIHQKIKNLSASTETPLLKPAVVRRVFINSHKSTDSSIWHEPKNIYYIEQQPKWNLDQIKIYNPSQDIFNLYQ
ncbi:MAG: hypothetical protein Rsou_0337 [Candidatus Ruthia sp. Asou_11_S2]|nr:hypothetical protein [Candidatus Ruthia sp. Asou_11_S2]